jgi:hypothetical protein
VRVHARVRARARARARVRVCACACAGLCASVRVCWCVYFGCVWLRACVRARLIACVSFCADCTYTSFSSSSSFPSPSSSSLPLSLSLSLYLSRKALQGTGQRGPSNCMVTANRNRSNWHRPASSIYYGKLTGRYRSQPISHIDSTQPINIPLNYNRTAVIFPSGAFRWCK